MDIIKFKELYDKGLTDADIARHFNCCCESARITRLKLKLPSNFSYKQFRKLDEEKLVELVNLGKKDNEIDIILNVKKGTTYFARKRWNITRDSFSIAKSISFTNRQKEILIGCLLGDGSLHLGIGCINPSFSVEHGYKQQDYCFWKYNELKSLNVKFKEQIRKTPDKRNGILYHSFTVKSPANPEFLELYKLLYNIQKNITIEYLSNYSALSLAVHFMDDGSKTTHSYCIATNSFSLNDLMILKQYFNTKFNLDFTIWKNHIIYIPKYYKSRFEELIKPYIINSMKYKLHNVS